MELHAPCNGACTSIVLLLVTNKPVYRKNMFIETYGEETWTCAERDIGSLTAGNMRVVRYVE
jgi:hypothetical protein